MIETVIGFPTIFDWMFVIGGCLGMLAHYLKKYVAKEITVSPIEYFLKNNWAASLLALIAFFMSMFGALASVPKEVNFYILIYLSFVTGYTSDSAFNRIDEDKKKIEGHVQKLHDREDAREDATFYQKLKMTDFSEAAKSPKTIFHDGG
jgi:uncharacterized membrane protein